MDAVHEAYGRRAREYADLLGTVDAAPDADRELIEAWARRHPGRVLDVGCGPGHWTDHLARLGADAEGVDPTPEFVALARERFPAVPFRLGGLPALDAPDASVDAALAWFSLIHTRPDRLPAALDELARILVDDGGLLVGFVTGADAEPFDHAVVTGYRWSVAGMSALLERAGFRILSSTARADPGVRPQAAIIASRLPRSSA
jgi:SAM-dependent methyltransferase